MTDIQTMFHQVQVSKGHVDYLRFNTTNGDTTQPPVEHCLLVDLFGAVPSPSCANVALKQLKTTRASSIPAYSAQLITFMLMIASDPSHLNRTAERALGLLWSAEDDMFKFNITVKEKPHTCIMSSGPLTAPVKLLLQECRSEQDWGSRIPQPASEKWRRSIDDLSVLENFEVVRNCMDLEQSSKLSCITFLMPVIMVMAQWVTSEWLQTTVTCMYPSCLVKQESLLWNRWPSRRLARAPQPWIWRDSNVQPHPSFTFLLLVSHPSQAQEADQKHWPGLKPRPLMWHHQCQSE